MTASARRGQAPRSSAAMLPLVVLVLAIMAAAGSGRDRHDATAHRSFHAVDHRVKVFDDPAGPLPSLTMPPIGKR